MEELGPGWKRNEINSAYAQARSIGGLKGLWCFKQRFTPSWTLDTMLDS
jgi:hypothetical protein